MNRLDKKKLLSAGILGVLLVYAYIVRYVITLPGIIPDTFLRFSREMIHMGIAIVWLISIRRRVMQKSVRFYMLSVTFQLILWQYIRAVKYYFFYDTSICRYLWYAYYIPIILIPLYCFYIQEYIGKVDSYEKPKRMQLLYLPALFLIGLVFTNDAHCLVFGFPEGFNDYDNYTYKICYFLVILWSIFLGIYSLVMLLMKCRAPGNRWFQRTPLLVLGGALVVWFLYGLGILNMDFTTVSCFVIILLLESSIQSGLIRTNSKYGLLFGTSTIEARITDDEFHPCYTSDTSEPVDETMMRLALSGSVNLENKRLRSAPISHGYVFWWDDVTDLNRYTKELEETGKELAHKNDLIKAELDLQEKSLRIAEKNRLYDRISREVNTQITEIEKLLCKESSSSDIRENLIKICIISAYIKRRSNLLLISEDTDDIPAKEMEFCLRESLDNLRLAGILCSLDSKCEGKVKANRLVAVYDMAQQAFEQTLCGLNALFIKLRISNGNIFMRLQMDCSCEVCFPEKTEWTALGGRVTARRSDDILWVEFHLEKGEDRI